MDQPKRPRSHELETMSRRRFESILPPSWVIHDRAHDYGVDCDVELFENGNATGRFVHIQLKSTDKLFDDLSLYVKASTYNYLLSHRYPTMFVVYSSVTDELKMIWTRDVPLNVTKKDNLRIRPNITINHSNIEKVVLDRFIFEEISNNDNGTFPRILINKSSIPCELGRSLFILTHKLSREWALSGAVDGDKTVSISHDGDNFVCQIEHGPTLNIPNNTFARIVHTDDLSVCIANVAQRSGLSKTCDHILQSISELTDPTYQYIGLFLACTSDSPGIVEHIAGTLRYEDGIATDRIRLCSTIRGYVTNRQFTPSLIKTVEEFHLSYTSCDPIEASMMHDLKAMDFLIRQPKRYRAAFHHLRRSRATLLNKSLGEQQIAMMLFCIFNTGHYRHYISIYEQLSKYFQNDITQLEYAQSLLRTGRYGECLHALASLKPGPNYFVQFEAALTSEAATFAIDVVGKTNKMTYPDRASRLILERHEAKLTDNEMGYVPIMKRYYPFDENALNYLIRSGRATKTPEAAVQIFSAYAIHNRNRSVSWVNLIWSAVNTKRTDLALAAVKLGLRFCEDDFWDRLSALDKRVSESTGSRFSLLDLVQEFDEKTPDVPYSHPLHIYY